MLPQPTSALALVLAGCGFTASGVVDGQKPIDVALDSNEQLPTSCAALHLATPTKPSGDYMVDPDGAGSDAPLLVTCDMTTADGGWTIIYLSDLNVLTTPVPYQSATPRLLGDAQSVLLAYRDAAKNLKAGTSYATFAMPTEWRNDSPFDYPGNDFGTMVSVNGAPASMKIVHYGYQSFTSFCGDPWLTAASPYGRLCIEGTNAPFFVGFATPVADNCSDSSVNWDTTPCAGNYRLSIAVR